MHVFAYRHGPRVIRCLLMAAAVTALAIGALLVSGTANAQGASQDKIIVSGASGQLGELVVKGLLAKGVPAKNLILVSRTPDSSGSTRSKAPPSGSVTSRSRSRCPPRTQAESACC